MFVPNRELYSKQHTGQLWANLAFIHEVRPQTNVSAAMNAFQEATRKRCAVAR